MNILFYLEPQIELNNPSFRLGALKNQIYKIAKQCHINLKADIKIIVGNGVEIHKDEIDGLNSFSDIIYINPLELYKVNKRPHEFIKNDFLGYENNEYEDFIFNTIKYNLGDEYKPDIVITWESTNNFLKKLFKNSFFIDLMPGFLSRDPYPELLSFDFNGFFKNSLLNDFDIERYEPKPEDLELIKIIRGRVYDNFFNEFNPFTREDIDPSNRYRKIILLPLQVSGYFSFDLSSGYNSSLDFVVDVLNSVPEDVGVVVTQYITPHTKDVVINENVKNYLEKNYSNFIFSERFNKVDNVSQYLLSIVDGVAAVSSSIGLQALIFKKPIFVFGTSQLTSISSGADSESIELALSKKEYVNDKLLSFLLSYKHVVSFNPVITDFWFSDLIKEYYKRWALGMRGQDLYINFNDFFQNYSSKFSASIREDISMRKLLGSNLSEKKKNEVKNTFDMMKKISDIHIEYVSFDIFDTLLERPMLKPSDLFRLIDLKSKDLVVGGFDNFSYIRIESERKLRKSLLEKQSQFNPVDEYGKIFLNQEITLDQIYKEIKKLSGLCDEVINKFKQLEISLELDLLRQRKIGRKLYDYAIRCKKKVIITSDMYLPLEVIEEALRKNGYNSHDKLYLSSEVGLRKHEGDLFSYVINDLGVIRPDIILHVGDNSHGDIKKSKEYGMKSLFLERSTVAMSRNKKFNSVYWSLRNNTTFSENTISGVISNRLFSNPNLPYWGDTHFNGDTINFGYSATGPLFLGFVKWIIDTAIKEEVTDLYFLARDGYILKGIYEKIAEYYENAPNAHYLYASRRSAKVCGIKKVSDIVSLAKTSFFGGTVKLFLEDKFGLDISTLSLDGLVNYGFNSFEDRIKNNDDKNNITDYLISIKDIVIHTANIERENYKSYLVESGLLQSDTVALVDIGYAGSMQNTIGDLLDRKDISGYYFMTFETASEVTNKGYDLKSFSGDFINPKRSKHPLLSNGLAYEVLFSCHEGSFEKVVFDSGRLKIKKKDVSNEVIKSQFLNLMWDGCFKFTDDYLSIYGKYLSCISITSDAAIAMVADFFSNPGGRDCEIFEGVTFDDAFAGAQIRYMVPPRRFMTKKPEDRLKSSVWKKGTEVFFRRGDLTNKIVSKVQKTNIRKNEDIQKDFTHLYTGSAFFDYFIKNKIKSGNINKEMKPLFIFKIALRLFSTKNKLQKYINDPIGYHTKSNNKWVKRIIVLS